MLRDTNRRGDSRPVCCSRTCETKHLDSKRRANRKCEFCSRTTRKYHPDEEGPFFCEDYCRERWTTSGLLMVCAYAECGKEYGAREGHGCFCSEQCSVRHRIEVGAALFDPGDMMLAYLDRKKCGLALSTAKV
jgi:hypothetical protein